MRYRLVSLILLAALALSACAPAAPAAPAAAPTAEPTKAPEAAAPTAPASLEQPVPGPSAPACRVLEEGQDSPLPPVTDKDWVLGGKDAAFTFVEYSDFQCPYCAMLQPEMVKLHEKYPQDVRVVFRHFPLPSHPLALISAQAAEAAGKQNKDAFFKMVSFLFDNQKEWSGLKTADEFKTWIKEKVSGQGLDGEQFIKDIDSEDVVAAVKAAQDEALKIGVPYTPFLLINTVPAAAYVNGNDLASLEQAMAMVKKLDASKQKECPALTIDPKKQYTATLKTSKGEVVIQLLADKAPVTVNSFIFLAKKGYYDGTPFHRVIEGFVAQGGDPTGSGTGGPGYVLADEISDLKYDSEGVVGMANSGAHTNGSQFFITYAAQPNLDGKYTIFGKVTSGMDVVKKLTKRNPGQDQELADPDVIETVTITEK